MYSLQIFSKIRSNKEIWSLITLTLPSSLKLDLAVDDTDIKFLIWKILFDFDKTG